MQMQILSFYIHSLLYRYDCVIIPDFGGFITKSMPSGADDTGRRFFPPRKSVAFNASLNQNDGLLANAIAVQEQISYKEAIDYIAAEVKSLQHNLHIHKTIAIEGIGTFKLTTEQALLFEPDSSCNYLIDTYGMGVISSLPISREEKVRTLSFEDRPAVVPASTVKMPARLKWASVLVIPVLLAFMLGVFNQNVLKGVHENYTNMVSSFVNLGDYIVESWHTMKDTVEIKKDVEETTNKDSVLLFPSKDDKKVISEEVAETTMAKEVPVAVPTEYTDYESKTLIIAGCFGVIDNARKLIADLRSKGYDARLAGTSEKGLHRVAIGVFFDEKEALKAKADFEQSGQSAWLSRN